MAGLCNKIGILNLWQSRQLHLIILFFFFMAVARLGAYQVGIYKALHEDGYNLIGSLVLLLVLLIAPLLLEIRLKTA